MKIICTNNSAAQDPSDVPIEMLRQQISSRVDTVNKIANEQGIDFWILSSRWGLVKSKEKREPYNLLAYKPNEDMVIDLIKRQIQENGIDQVVYYAYSPAIDASVRMYLGILQKACEGETTNLQCIEMEDPKIEKGWVDNWKLVTELAAIAGQRLVIDRTSGERAFEELCKEFPDNNADAMLYYHRGVAYVELLNFGLAKKDLENARVSFPKPRWKEEAAKVLVRIDELQAEGGTISEARRNINKLNIQKDGISKKRVLNILNNAISNPAIACHGMRTELEMILEGIWKEANISDRDLTNYLHDRKRRVLKDSSTMTSYLQDNRKEIPKYIISHLHTIRSIGNCGSHKERIIDPPRFGDAYVGVTALVALLEWRNGSRRDTDR